jgi:uncharacterized protein (DUF3820 family)
MSTATIANESTVLTFGKFKGRTVGELIKENPAYLLWAHEKVEFFELPPELLARLHDRKPRLTFSFQVDELKQMKFDLELLQDPPTGAIYAAKLMAYLIQEFSNHKEIKLTAYDA